MNPILTTLKIEQLGPLSDVVTALNSDLGYSDALDLSILLKRAESFLGSIRSGIRPQANVRFDALQVAQPELKNWTVGNGYGVVYKYAPKSKWEYPQEVRDAETRLKALQKNAQEEGTAQRTTPSVDPVSGTMFAIKLAETF